MVPDKTLTRSQQESPLLSWSADRGYFRLRVSLHRSHQLSLLSHQEAYRLSTEDLRVKVPSQQFTGLCEVRVRVQPAVPPNEHWSDWSPTTSWFGATETAGTVPDDEGTVSIRGLMPFPVAAFQQNKTCCFQSGSWTRRGCCALWGPSLLSFCSFQLDA